MSKNVEVKKIIKEFNATCKNLISSKEKYVHLVEDYDDEIRIQAAFHVVQAFSQHGIAISCDQAERILNVAGALQDPDKCHRAAIWLQLTKSDRSALRSILEHAEGRLKGLN